MSEMQQNVAVNRDWCLRSLIGQAEGRKVHAQDDHYLIEQLNASHVGDTAEGNVTQCQVGECALRCLTVNESGVLRELASKGEAVCE